MSLKNLVQNLKNKFSGEQPDEVTREDGTPPTVGITGDGTGATATAVLTGDTVTSVVVMPPIKPGKVPLSALARLIRWRKERKGKTRDYRKRNIPYMGSFRKLRMHQIRMSQLQGIEVANALRAAKKVGTRAAMHEFLLRNYPMSNHNARA